MTYRYCSECDWWFETAEIELSESGETMCPEHDSVHASIVGGPRGFPIDEREFVAQNGLMKDYDDALQAAHRQGLVE